MQWPKFALLVVVLLFLCSLVAIADSEVVVEPIKNEVVVREEALFKLTITNNAQERVRYSIYSLQSGQGWNVDPRPLKDKIIEIGPGGKYSTIIIAQALEDFSPGIYNILINIESDLGERETKALKIYLSPEKPLDYLPSIKATVDMDEKISPKEPLSIKLFLENKNPLDLTGLTIKLQSEMPEFVKEVAVDLPPLEKKTVEFAVTPNPYQQPKEYALFFVFERGEQTVKVIEKRIEVVTVLPKFTQDLTQNTLFLKTFYQLKVTNEGNVRNTQKVTVPISLFSALFTLGEGKLEKVEGQRRLVWELSLGPNESTTINYVTNFRLIIYTAVFLLLLFMIYLYIRSPLVLIKSAQTKKGEEEGSLSQIKITLEVKNKSKKPLKEVEITDLVPGIANLEKGLELGTLKPKEVKHLKKGTKVIWSLAEIEGYEHRLITYSVKAKLNILGMFSLPRATATYKKGRRGRKAYSNLFRLGD